MPTVLTRRTPERGRTTFHSLPIGKKGSDIDHIVVGPGGLFTINTRAEPVLALVNPKPLTIKTKPERVTVIRATRLRRWLTERTSVLSETELREIATVMDYPTTWPSTALPTFSDSSERFAKLHQEVQRARFRRRVWSFTCSLFLIAELECIR